MYFRGQVVLVVAVFVALTQPGESRRFSRCGLARELRRQGFPMHQLPDWVCLVESESSRDTAAIGRLNDDGSEDHGLFQISDKFWCGRGYTGKGCNVNCDELRTDDISKAARCAMTVFQTHGFHGWMGWKDHCQESLPDISCCFQGHSEF